MSHIRAATRPSVTTHSVNGSEPGSVRDQESKILRRARKSRSEKPNSPDTQGVGLFKQFWLAVDISLSARRQRPVRQRTFRQGAEDCLLTHKSSRCLGLLGFPPDPVHKGPLCSEADFRSRSKAGQTSYYERKFELVKEQSQESWQSPFGREKYTLQPVLPALGKAAVEGADLEQSLSSQFSPPPVSTFLKSQTQAPDRDSRSAETTLFAVEIAFPVIQSSRIAVT